MHIGHHEALTAFVDQLSTFMDVRTDLDDDQLLAVSGELLARLAYRLICLQSRRAAPAEERIG